MKFEFDLYDYYFYVFLRVLVFRWGLSIRPPVVLHEVDSASAPNARCTVVHMYGVNGALIARGKDAR